MDSAAERQLALFGDDALDAALRRLGPHADAVFIQYKETRRQLYAWQRDAASGVVQIRAHRVFRDAPDDVADALLRVVLRRLSRVERRTLTHRVNAWFSTRADAPSPAAARRAPTRDSARGRHVDLRAAFGRMCAARLEAPLAVDLAWSARPARRILGKYERGEPRGRITINVLLDSPKTPPWYLDFLLFHEALHAIHPPRPGRGRMIVHPPELRRAERAHPDHGRARTFEQYATGRGFGEFLDSHG